MSKLIEQFLETHRQCTMQDSVFNISQALDQEALAIIEQAQTEARNRSKNKSAKAKPQQKIFEATLAARLTRLLERVDLLNKVSYNTLRNAIQRWCPWQAGQQSFCIQVQQSLLTLLPAARQKQELRQLCQEYKSHLAEEIESQAKKDSEQNYFICSNSRTLLFGAPPVEHHCVLMLNEMPASGADKNTIYLIKDKKTDAFIAYWDEKGVMIPHELKNEKPTTDKLESIFKPGKRITLQDPHFEKTVSLCGYIPPVNDRAQVKSILDVRAPVEKFTAEPKRDIVKLDQPLSLTVQKYQAVSALQETLATPVKSAVEQLKDFRTQFTNQREIIEKNRDSWAIKFVKGVATVFSVGIAWACGIWNIKGKEAAKSLQTVLDQPPAPLVNCRVG